MNPEVQMIGLFCAKCRILSPSTKKCSRCGNNLSTVTFNLQTGLTKNGEYYPEQVLREAMQVYISREKDMELTCFKEES